MKRILFIVLFLFAASMATAATLRSYGPNNPSNIEVPSAAITGTSAQMYSLPVSILQLGDTFMQTDTGNSWWSWNGSTWNLIQVFKLTFTWTPSPLPTSTGTASFSPTPTPTGTWSTVTGTPTFTYSPTPLTPTNTPTPLNAPIPVNHIAVGTGENYLTDGGMSLNQNIVTGKATTALGTYPPYNDELQIFAYPGDSGSLNLWGGGPLELDYTNPTFMIGPLGSVLNLNSGEFQLSLNDGNSDTNGLQVYANAFKIGSNGPNANGNFQLEFYPGMWSIQGQTNSSGGGGSYSDAIYNGARQTELIDGSGNIIQQNLYQGLYQYEGQQGTGTSYQENINYSIAEDEVNWSNQENYNITSYFEAGQTGLLYGVNNQINNNGGFPVSIYFDVVPGSMSFLDDINQINFEVFSGGINYENPNTNCYLNVNPYFFQYNNAGVTATIGAHAGPELVRQQNLYGGTGTIATPSVPVTVALYAYGAPVTTGAIYLVATWNDGGAEVNPLSYAYVGVDGSGANEYAFVSLSTGTFQYLFLDSQ